MEPRFIVNAKFLEKSEWETNGVLRFVREVSLRLKALDNRIQFICPTHIEENVYAKTLSPIRVGSYGGAFWEQVVLPLILTKRFKGYYLLNLNNISPLFYRHNISTIMDLTWKHFPETFDTKSRIYLSTVVPLVIRNARKIITLSHFSKKDLLRHYKLKDEKVKVIYPGFYHNTKDTEGAPAEETLNRFGLAPKKYFLATIYKNPTRLIEAFKQLNDLDVNLVLFGHLFKDVFGHLLPEIQTNKKICYAGKVSDPELSQLYASATAFVFPSLSEGFGMPPLEAMARQCPVIASNVSSIPEVCGDAALYVNPYDIQDIADKMRMLYLETGLQNELIEKGNRRTGCFNYDKTVADLINYLESIGIYKK